MVVTNATDALVAMFDESGATKSMVSESLGHRSNYVNVFINKRHDVQTSTLARMARECGYVLTLVPAETDWGEPIEILPE